MWKNNKPRFRIFKFIKESPTKAKTICNLLVFFKDVTVLSLGASYRLPGPRKKLNQSPSPDEELNSRPFRFRIAKSSVKLWATGRGPFKNPYRSFDPCPCQSPFDKWVVPITGFNKI